VTVVPDSLPGKKFNGWTLIPVTFILKSDAAAVPPLSLMTFLITVNVPGWSEFVTVHVFDSPMAIVPVQSDEKLSVYPAGPASPTL
jgi:hypothetical protein